MLTESGSARRALLVIDLFDAFRQPNSEARLASLRDRMPGVSATIHGARADGTRVVFANGLLGGHSCSADQVVEQARRGRAAVDLGPVLPRDGELFVVKPLASAFEQTELDLRLRRFGVADLFVCGGTTEHTVTATVAGARERGFRVTVIRDALVTDDPIAENAALAYQEAALGVRAVASTDVFPAGRATGTTAVGVQRGRRGAVGRRGTKRAADLAAVR